jgi:hypothetical protein
MRVREGEEKVLNGSKILLLVLNDAKKFQTDITATTFPTVTQYVELPKYRLMQPIGFGFQIQLSLKFPLCTGSPPLFA